jgi:hypothetical protein
VQLANLLFLAVFSEPAQVFRRDRTPAQAGFGAQVDAKPIASLVAGLRSTSALPAGPGTSDGWAITSPRAMTAPWR